MNKGLFAAGLLSAAAMLCEPVTAATIDLATLVGTYDIQDNFNPIGSFFDNDYFASSATIVKFTDLYVVGDEYNVYVNGAFLSFAGVPGGADFAAYETDPDIAYASGNYTGGLVTLAAGDTLSFQIAAIPAGYADATIAVTSLGAVPEPASWAMMIGGFGMIGGALRARRRATVRFA